LPIKLSLRPNAVWCVSYLDWFVQFSWSGNMAHSGCDQSTGDAYSSWVPDPTSGISRGLCLPHSLICISYRTYETNDSSLFMPFHGYKSSFYTCKTDSIKFSITTWSLLTRDRLFTELCPFSPRWIRFNKWRCFVWNSYRWRLHFITVDPFLTELCPLMNGKNQFSMTFLCIGWKYML
jgi:hypothetical protein